MTTVQGLLSQQYIIILLNITALAKSRRLLSSLFKNKIFGRSFTVARSSGISGTGGGKNRNHIIFYALRQKGKEKPSQYGLFLNQQELTT